MSPKTESESGITAIDRDKLFTDVKITLNQKNS